MISVMFIVCLWSSVCNEKKNRALLSLYAAAEAAFFFGRSAVSSEGLSELLL